MGLSFAGDLTDSGVCVGVVVIHGCLGSMDVDYVAVFDGHAGNELMHYCVTAMHEELIKQLALASPSDGTTAGSGGCVWGITKAEERSRVAVISVKAIRGI